MAVPGWPLPAFWTASAARHRTVSTARTSRSVHPARVAIGAASDVSRLVLVAAWLTSEMLRSVTDRAYPEKDKACAGADPWCLMSMCSRNGMRVPHVICSRNLIPQGEGLVLGGEDEGLLDPVDVARQVGRVGLGIE